MKPILFCTLFLGMAGCGSINDINYNMVRTNELMDQNIVVTTDAQGTINHNTEAITRSNDSMVEFEDVIKENTSAVSRIMDEIESNSTAFSLGLIALLALLFLPSVILIIFYFKFLRTMKSYMRK